MGSLLRNLDQKLAKLESWLCIVLLSSLVLLILINIATRTFNLGLYWVDELAIYLMIWMTFFATSLSIHKGLGMQVLFVFEKLPHSIQSRVRKVWSLLILGFWMVLLFYSCRWFNPLENNFIYQEPTITLSLQKFWVWSVLPVISAFSAFHALVHVMCSSDA